MDGLYTTHKQIKECRESTQGAFQEKLNLKKCSKSWRKEDKFKKKGARSKQKGVN